jgi:hypothetical protein
VPDFSAFDVEMAIDKLDRNKPPNTDQILAEFIKVLGRTILSEINKLINSIWNMEELPEQYKESISVPIHKQGDKTDRSIH